MAHHTPDGMGADRHRERENMKAARQETHTPPWELAALDEAGNELYRTEYAGSREEAEQLAQEADPSRHEGVDSFVPVETDG